MTKYNSILVPIDGSDNAKRALEQAVDLATTYGASITLAYVAHDIAPLANFDQISFRYFLIILLSISFTSITLPRLFLL